MVFIPAATSPTSSFWLHLSMRPFLLPDGLEGQIWSGYRSMCRMCRLGRIHICPIRSTSRNERPCTKRRFPDYITGIYMHPRSTHHTATLHSSQPGHLFAVVLLRCGDKLSLRRDWRNQEVSRRLASLCTLFRLPVLHKGLASHRQVRRIDATNARDHFTGL